MEESFHEFCDIAKHIFESTDWKEREEALEIARYEDKAAEIVCKIEGHQPIIVNREMVCARCGWISKGLQWIPK